MNAKRYSQRPFPAYRFIPGVSPHPTRDPKGHSYEQPEPTLDSFDTEGWLECEPYLFGVDLFNHGYWWEAHEAWEVVWKCVGRGSQPGLFLQGLIQIAAAMLKSEQGIRIGAERLVKTGTDKLSLVRGSYLGVDVETFSRQAREHVKGDRRSRPFISLGNV